jgi:hypothetical protein
MKHYALLAWKVIDGLLVFFGAFFLLFNNLFIPGLIVPVFLKASVPCFLVFVSVFAGEKLARPSKTPPPSTDA